MCEFSRVHAEFGAKNEWRHFKARRVELFRILTRLRIIAASQDKSFERTLAFVLANNPRHSYWLALEGKDEVALTPQDLDWAPAKWWKHIAGENSDKAAPNRANRRQLDGHMSFGKWFKS